MEVAFASFSVDLIFKSKYDTTVNIRSLKETKGVLKGSLSGKKNWQLMTYEKARMGLHLCSIEYKEYVVYVNFLYPNPIMECTIYIK